MTGKSTAFRFGAVLMAMMMTAPLASWAQEKASPADQRKALHADVEAAVARIKKSDPGVDKFFRDSAGYVVFPRAGKGGFIFVGGHGDGELFEKGKVVGTASLSLGTVGLSIGGQQFNQFIFFQNAAALDRFKQNKFEFTAGVSAVIVKEGAAMAGKYTDGVAVFVQPVQGAMADASVGAQKFNFKPDSAAAKK
jgi:lipid-binding SYLF domain-containing protein